MTLDASALVTIHRRGADWEQLVQQAMDSGNARVPATALAEAGMILIAQGDLRDLVGLIELVQTLKLTVVPFTERDWCAAVHEYRRRRDSDTYASARFGDCLTAAVAVRTGTTVLAAPKAG